MGSEFASWIDENKIVPLESHLLGTAKLAEGLLGRDWEIVSERFGISEDLLKYASLLHDVGKVAFYRIVGTPISRPSDLLGFKKNISFYFHELFSTLCAVCLEETNSIDLDEDEYFILEASVLFHHFGMQNRIMSKKLLTFGELKIEQLMKLKKKGGRYRTVLDFEKGKIYSKFVGIGQIVDEMLRVLPKIGLPKVGDCEVSRAMSSLRGLLINYINPENSSYPALFALLGYLSVADSLAASIERDGMIPPSGYKGRLMNELGVSEEDIRGLLQDTGGE